MGAGRDRCRGRFAPRRGVSQAASHGFCKRPSAPRTAASNLGSSTAPTLKRAHTDLALPGLQRNVAVTDHAGCCVLAAIALIILKAKFCGEWLISGCSLPDLAYTHRRHLLRVSSPCAERTAWRLPADTGCTPISCTSLSAGMPLAVTQQMGGRHLGLQCS